MNVSILQLAPAAPAQQNAPLHSVLAIAGCSGTSAPHILSADAHEAVSSLTKRHAVQDMSPLRPAN